MKGIYSIVSGVVLVMVALWEAFGIAGFLFAMGVLLIVMGFDVHLQEELER